MHLPAASAIQQCSIHVPVEGLVLPQAFFIIIRGVSATLFPLNFPLQFPCVIKP